MAKEMLNSAEISEKIPGCISGGIFSIRSSNPKVVKVSVPPNGPISLRMSVPKTTEQMSSASAKAGQVGRQR